MDLHKNIPKEYREYWEPYRGDKILLHITTKLNFENIKKIGCIEPRDPSPKHWTGMKAIFLSDPDDPLYPASLEHVLAHVKEKHEALIQLHIKTKNHLYRSIDPARTFQVISLDPIDIDDIVKVESLEDLIQK